MTKSYPKYSSLARKGDRGIELVSRLFNEKFGWLFKRNHQEHDFGIDAQIDVILQDGSVTGQMVALQIKYGSSFFEEQNKWGYVYRGQRKHFNYLSNYPTLVLIVICDPATEDCYWVEFSPEDTTPAGENWKILIPFGNKLADSKPRIEALLPSVADNFEEMRDFWEFNDVLKRYEHFQYVVSREDVECLNVTDAQEFFAGLKRSKELAMHCQGKVEITFHGYEVDERELYEIQEVRRYVPHLLAVIPDIFFFAYTGENGHTLQLLALCLSEINVVSKLPNATNKVHVNASTAEIKTFLESHFAGLNSVTDWLGMPLEENKRISFEVVNSLGFRVSDGSA